ncbi:biliverdin-producing heme oxygenase, partial [Pseudomonas meliae]|uniref:biliverdin-producing heme oxygenase n=2 Tax=Pseudomonas meliae TaxID=86176 RepID=UPI000AE6731C
MPASFSCVTPPKLLDALRAETSQLHVKLEKRMPFFSPALDHALYLRLLKAYYGFYAPLEAALHDSALMHRNFKMPMHQADAMTEASCLHSDV